MMRHDLRKQKQKLIAENLPMTESEPVEFWAVYQKYSDELKEMNDEKFAMLHAYAQNWRTMSNDDSLLFMRRWLEVDEKVVQLFSCGCSSFGMRFPCRRTMNKRAPSGSDF